MVFLLVPENVPGPTAVRRPRELEVHWTEPGRPNGVITQYNLTRMDEWCSVELATHSRYKT